MTTTETNIPVTAGRRDSGPYTPIECAGHHDYYSPQHSHHVTTPGWFYPTWSKTGFAPFYHPLNYDAVAPWAFDHTLNRAAYNPYQRRDSFGALSPYEREMWNQTHDHEQGHSDHRNSFSSELNFHPSRPGSVLEHNSLLNPVRLDNEGNRWLNCFFNMRSYKPEEITITLNAKEGFLSIEAGHEVDEAKKNYVKRSYSRKVFLGHLNVDLGKLEFKSWLTNDGLLCIEAALPKVSREEARALSKFMVGHPGNVYNIPVTKQ
jgi:hypothetical protein